MKIKEIKLKKMIKLSENDINELLKILWYTKGNIFYQPYPLKLYNDIREQAGLDIPTTNYTQWIRCEGCKEFSHIEEKYCKYCNKLFIDEMKHDEVKE